MSRLSFSHRNSLAKGYVTRIVSNSSKEDEWYLPHFLIPGVETTKVCVVFDAAADSAGVSLNQQIYVGPKLQQDLLPVLLRFCAEPVAFVADIAEMFLQVMVQEKDRQYLRFLWRPKPAEPVQRFEFSRLVFGLKSSPFLACKALHHVADTFQNRFSS